MGMLLAPQRDERRLEPISEGTQPVDLGVAAGAQGDQKARLMDSRPTVVDGELASRPAATASAVVTLQNLVAVAGEAAREWASLQ